jgi:hypothetical protein
MKAARIVRIVIILLLIGIPLYFLMDKNPSDQALMVGAGIYALLIIIGIYGRYFGGPKS